jgi:micrococcal nuclease
MRKFLQTCILGIGLATLGISSISNGANFSEKNKLNLQPNHKYICYVSDVIDGDTIKCRLDFKITQKVKSYNVRLIGIDTPETGLKKKNTGKQAKEIEEYYRTLENKEVDITRREVVKMGLKAKKFTETLLAPYYAVILETDVEPFDKYGRILGYIWLPNGKMLNKEIICNGYAMPLTIPPNVKYHKIFLKCFREAFKEGKGLWKEK